MTKKTITCPVCGKPITAIKKDKKKLVGSKYKLSATFRFTCLKCNKDFHPREVIRPKRKTTIIS